MDLIEEYKAAERADYVTWGMTGHVTKEETRIGSLEEDV